MSESQATICPYCECRTYTKAFGCTMCNLPLSADDVQQELVDWWEELDELKKPSASSEV